MRFGPIHTVNQSGLLQKFLSCMYGYLSGHDGRDDYIFLERSENDKGR